MSLKVAPGRFNSLKQIFSVLFDLGCQVLVLGHSAFRFCQSPQPISSRFVFLRQLRAFPNAGSLLPQAVKRDI
jgi:hypothetical protein